MIMMMLVLRDLAPRVVAKEVVLPLLLPLLVSQRVPLLMTGVVVVAVAILALALALVGCKARARACSSAQSRPSISPLWSKVRMLLATLLFLPALANADGCSTAYGTIDGNGHLTVPNNVTAIDSSKLVIV